MEKNNRYYEEKARTLAKRRARKYEVLFEEANFGKIMTAAEAKNVDEFSKVCRECQGAKLDEAEIKWLWGYLQHSDKALWDPVADLPAAYTGW